MNMRTKVVLTTLFMMLAIPLSAQSPQKVAFKVNIVRIPNAPVQVVELLPPAERPYDGPQVRVRNETDQAVAGFMIVYVVTVPPGCPTHSDTLQPGFLTGLRFESTALQPRATEIARETVAPSAFVKAFETLHAAYIHVQVAVTKVVFADGSEWQDNNVWTNRVFDERLLKADPCPVPTGTPGVEKVVAVRYSDPDTSRPGARIELQPDGYTYSCSLRDGNAYCPVDWRSHPSSKAKQ